MKYDLAICLVTEKNKVIIGKVLAIDAIVVFILYALFFSTSYIESNY